MAPRYLLVPLLVVGAVFGSPRDSAGQPAPGNSTIPTFIDVVGTHGGIPDPLGQFSVIVRDLANNPMPGVQVTIDFSQCPDTRVALAQGAGLAVHAANNAVSRVTNAAGVAVFTIVGAGTLGCDLSTCPPGVPNCARICAGGVLLGSTSVAIFDLDGASPTGIEGVNILDQEHFTSDFFCGANPPRSNFDHLAGVSASDLARFIGVIYAGAINGTGSPQGSNGAGYASGPFTPFPCP